jgi:hypothetical protein
LFNASSLLLFKRNSSFNTSSPLLFKVTLPTSDILCLIVYFLCRLKINHDTHEFILEFSTVANNYHHVLQFCSLDYCSGSRRRAEKADKRMALEHTHGLFIT